MKDEFLSISIPTRNRSHLLRDLLTSLAREITEGQLSPGDVRIFVSDNASTDATRAVAHEILGKFPHFNYSCNERNIGGCPNIILCANKGQGTYRWLIGDDEYLPPGGLTYLLGHLREHQPGWFIHSDGKYRGGLKPPCTFANIAEFARAAARLDPMSLIYAGGISLCTFRHDCYDYPLAKSLELTSSYPHFFGLMNGLRRSGAPVFLTDRATIIFREQRPAPSDGQLPSDSDANWRQCIEWIRTELDMPSLDPEILSKLVSEDYVRQMLRHPWRTFRNNAPLLLIPGSYPRIFKRLWYMVKR